MDNIECAICLEKIDETNNYAITPCRHKFCFNCILQSIQTINTCPYCRTVLIVELNEDQDENEDENEENNNEDLYNEFGYLDKILFNIKRILSEGFTIKELYYIISILLLKNYFSMLSIYNKINFINIIVKECYFNEFLYNDFLYNNFLYNNFIYNNTIK